MPKVIEPKISEEKQRYMATYRAMNKEKIAKQRRKRRAIYYAENREEILFAARKRYIDNREKYKARRAAYFAAHPGAVRARNLKKYGLTPELWEKLFDTQERKCAICKRKDLVGRNWSVDHDHSTGKVRGIVCLHCNTILGHAFDNPEIMQAAIGYLKCQK